GEVAEFYQPVAELKGVNLALQVDGAATIAGDPLLLSQALANLVENALKYASASRLIAIAVRSAGNVVEVAVADQGPGIPDAEKRGVVERFYRGDVSGGRPGVGLGLSLVAAVARLHGGRLELRDTEPGLEAALLLPPMASVRRESAKPSRRAEPSISLAAAS